MVINGKMEDAKITIGSGPIKFDVGNCIYAYVYNSTSSEKDLVYEASRKVTNWGIETDEWKKDIEKEAKEQEAKEEKARLDSLEPLYITRLKNLEIE